MALRIRKTMPIEGLLGLIGRCRFYSSNSKVVDWRKLRPMILKRIQERAKDYPIKAMTPVAQEVLTARTLLFRGVSTLLQRFPVWACKFCPEVYIGEKGHLIRTCGGYRHRSKNLVHEWIHGCVNDILVPVETFHLYNMFQAVIKHDERFDFERISAVVELCLQAGADVNDESLSLNTGSILHPSNRDAAITGVESLSPNDLRLIAKGTLHAWETLRSGVLRLLLVYPAKVCKFCSEVSVGPSGHKARLCGLFKHEIWRGKHFWKKADVDDLVPSKVMWFKRPQDPPVLLHEGRDYYGHAPAVVHLCTKAGALAPSKYFCMMKLQGLSAPLDVRQ